MYGGFILEIYLQWAVLKISWLCRPDLIRALPVSAGGDTRGMYALVSICMYVLMILCFLGIDSYLLHGEYVAAVPWVRVWGCGCGAGGRGRIADSLGRARPIRSSQPAYIHTMHTKLKMYACVCIGDARLLARTWLQDDGQIEEVLEITRFDSVVLYFISEVI